MPRPASPRLQITATPTRPSSAFLPPPTDTIAVTVVLFRDHTASRDGIVAQAPEVRCSLSNVVAFGVVASVAFAGVLEPVEQRPPIASV
ncbi:hypothetical protein ACOJBM_16990 [Rhizobium beringeri]